MKEIPKFRLFTVYSLAFLFGVAIASFISIDYKRSYSILIYSILALAVTALFNILFKNYSLTVVSISLAGIFCGLFYYSHFEFKTRPNLVYGEEQQIEGQVIKKPATDYKKQNVVIKTKGQKILVTMPHYPNVYYGDVIKFRGTIEKPGKIEDFDYGQYLKKDLIFGTVMSPQDPVAYSVKLKFNQKIYKFLFLTSDKFEASINRIFPEPDASLVAGLILGIKRNISDSFKNDLSITGLTHIIALSGYNVTIIVAVLADLLVVYLGRKKVFIVGSIFIVGFVILTGASSSVVRAAIFSFLVMYGKIIGRRADFTNIIILAALVMVLVNPFVLALDVGFQLSFLAFCGLIYFSPITAKIFERHRTDKLPDWVKVPLIETLSAQIAVFPLILSLFGRVSIIGPISNLAVLWIVPWSMGLSFVAGFLGMIFYPLGKLAALVAWPLLQYIIRMVELMAKIPGASIATQKGVWQVEAALYVILILLVAFLSKRFKITI